MGGLSLTPGTWLTVAAVVIVTAGQLAHGWITSRHNNEIRYQVTNSHGTNLRDDIDALTDLVADGFKEVSRDIGGMREELRTERTERIEGDRRRQ